MGMGEKLLGIKSNDKAAPKGSSQGIGGGGGGAFGDDDHAERLAHIEDHLAKTSGYQPLKKIESKPEAKPKAKTDETHPNDFSLVHTEPRGDGHF